jgi:thiol-disulfide isomerase/thioredoxin
MNRNTIIGLTLLVLILVATGLWRYQGYKENVRRQQEITRLLQQTQNNPSARLDVLDSIIVAYPDDQVIQRVARYQLVRAHGEIGSSESTLVRAAHSFLDADSSGAALNYVASVYANNDITDPNGIQYAQAALLEAQTMAAPENLHPDQWVDQRRLMIGETLHILGRLQVINARIGPALESLEAAVDSVPDSPGILRSLADLYDETGNRSGALQMHMSVLRLVYNDDDARAGVERLYPVLYGYRTSTITVIDTLIANARERRRENILGGQIAKDLPAFELIGPGEAMHSAEALRGKVLVINAWATWCVPCQKQLPVLQKAYDRFGDRSDVSFLMVSFDEEQLRVPPYLERNGYTFPVAYGDRNLYHGLGIQGIPTTIVADTSGTMRFNRLGFSEIGDPIEELGWQIEAARNVVQSDEPAETM